MGRGREAYPHTFRDSKAITIVGSLAVVGECVARLASEVPGGGSDVGSTVFSSGFSEEEEATGSLEAHVTYPCPGCAPLGGHGECHPPVAWRPPVIRLLNIEGQGKSRSERTRAKRHGAGRPWRCEWPSGCSF